ncbi:SGNH/GDSL hydrolase family protein [Neobacillus terrae]|uniref:SGNH/GDSL hydrolase family protein n=1 Tax=Neobacillus terrae TaxID=3034837 RepID=UPI00140D3954|nr:SGNH/GDSL hydrolase family protein [Neobacillus terrae]NHM30022.1 SGNH/GDSL hydrolase family protein [Neobacillus terrae]
MKVFFTIVLGICCMVILILGQIHWKESTLVSANKPNSPEEQAFDNDTSAPKLKSKEINKKQDSSINTYLSMAANWPHQAQESFKKSLIDKKLYKVLIVGSNAINTSKGSWSSMVAKQLEETYGKKNMKVTVRTYDLNSMQFINQKKYLELVNESADLVLFEPFTLNDNGEVVMENSLENLSTFMEAFKQKNPSVAFIIQPPHPLYQAKFYPKQVDALKEYAKQDNITYLDHWPVWPDPNSEEIKSYLLADQSGPNEKGNKVWGDFLLNYFIKK